MDKRFLLALVLAGIVIVVTPLIFPSAPPRPPAVVADTTRGAVPPRPDSGAVVAPPAASAVAPPANSIKTELIPPSSTAETTTVRTTTATYAFSSRGGAPVSVVLDSYPSRRRPLTPSRKAQLVPPGAPLTRYRFAFGADTVRLDTIALQPQQGAGASPTVSYAGTAAGRPIRLDYQFLPDSFLIRVRASAAGAPAGSQLLLDLPRSLYSNEPDTLEDIGHLAVSYRDPRGDVSSVAFSKLDSGKTQAEAGPLRWVATRNKYFLVAYRAPDKNGFSSLQLGGLPRTDKVAGALAATAALPLAADGSATFDIYAGPQDFRRLRHLGADLDQVNPYGGWLNGVVQPFATIVMRALLWMKDTTKLNYGWVLVLFGVLVRLVVWPLNQGAMRTTMKVQRLQPEMQALQKKYGDDRQKYQEATMKLYKDHGMSPLSPVIGCLPMLLPMPILFALYFVFQNTIEFRGVSFLWLPDISLHDPYYITPVFMGLSMFVVSWIGMKGSPPNPQAKMMMYMMPVMLTVFFLNLASGLNLYYAVQNVASIPQQWLLARERTNAGPVPTATIHGPSAAVKRRS